MTGNLNPTTPAQGWPVPTDGQDPDIPDDINRLAKAIEKRVIGVYANSSTRDSFTVSAGLEEGMFAYTKDDKQVWYWNGSAWINFPPKPPSITSGYSVPSNAVGSDGDVYYQI